MSLIIDLGNNSRSRSPKGKDLDPVITGLEYLDAAKDLAEAGVANEALALTAKDLEAAMELSAAVADRDERVAVVVAHEMTSLALSNIGQESYADEIIAGTEDITVANESISDTLKKVWEKMKEYAKKVWEFIRNLIYKVVDFVAALFGKEGASYKELEELLKKVEKDKRTYLEESEFSEATAKRLAPKVGAALLTIKGKLTGGEIIKFLDNMASYDAPSFEVKSENVVAVNSTGDNTTVTLFSNDVTKDNAYGIVVAAIKKIIGNDSVNINVDKNGIKGEIALDKTDEEPFKTLNDYIEVDDKYTGYVYKCVTYRENKIGFVIIGSKENGFESADNKLKDDASTEDILTAIKDMLNSLEVTYVEVKPTESDISDKIEDVVPIDFSDAKSIVNKMKDLGKKAEKEGDKAKKDIDKAAKNIEKKVEDIVKGLEPLKDNTTVKNALEGALVRYFNLNANWAKEVARGFAETHVGLAKNNFADIVKESVRLYKKNK